MAPRWKPEDLEAHYLKHPAGEDKQCWMDCLLKTTPVTKPEYEGTSIDVVLSHMLSGTMPHRIKSCELRFYRTYVNSIGIRSIVTGDGELFETCYHLHDRNRQHYNPHKTPADQIEAIVKERLRDELSHYMPKGARISIGRR